MNKQISFVGNDDTQKLFNYIYQGCNILRGPIYPEEYKTYGICRSENAADGIIKKSYRHDCC